MATVTFSAADDLLYAYLAGEIDHDAAQNLRIQLDDALLTRTPRTLVPCGHRLCRGSRPRTGGIKDESGKQHEDPI